jgi:hypothetical protein
MRVQGAAVTALVGAVATALTAAVTGLDTPLGWGTYGLIVGGLCGYIASQWVMRDRPGSFLLLAVLLQAAAVLAFPLLGPILGLETPLLSGRHSLGNVGAMYLATPMGFLVAVPFVPATLTTAFLAGGLIRMRWANSSRSNAISATEAVHWTDRVFSRGVLVAVGLEVLLTIVGYLWLTEAVSNRLQGY